MLTSIGKKAHDTEPAVVDLADKLVRISERRTTSTFARVRFPDDVDRRCPVMPPELTTLLGHPAYDQLDEDTRWRLGLLETVNFFSLNIHGEQALVAGLADRLYRGRWVGDSPAVSRYLQHFIHEENSHTYMLAEFCTRYYGRVMPEIVYRFENPVLSRPGEDLLFFGRIYVLEMFLHFVNRAAIRHAGLEPTARAIHRSHDLDESQHIAFDRSMIAAIVDQMRGEALDAEIACVTALLRNYAEYAFSRLVNPRIYRELGLDAPLLLARDVQAMPRWTELKARCRQNQDAHLKKVGLVS